MATVYLARDLKHDRPVALKVLHPELASTLGPTRFLQEIRFTAKLSHPHILPVHDSGEAGGHLWYTMPYVEGESLRARLSHHGRLPLAAALRIGREVAEALDYAHRHGVIHRDIKPENILLEDEQAVVADFGIARAVEAAGGEHLTSTGLTIGTPAYMSPEQAAGVTTDLDGRSDLYSLGIVLFEMLAGEPLFTGPSPQAVIAQRFRDQTPSLEQLPLGIPNPLRWALAKTLEREPASRFASAGEFARVLGQTQDSTAAPTTTRPFASRSNFGFPRLLWAVAIMVAITVGAVLFARLRAGAPGPEPPGFKMLVVLPFKNLGAPVDQYFADGLSEEITSRLASVSGLGVISRTSADQYRDTKKPLKQIGRELGVGYVLEGSVRWEKRPDGRSRLRVTPQLIQVVDDRHLWANQYDAELADVFEVQSELARQVVGALDITLRGTEREALSAQPTANLDAYDFYLRGKAHERRTPLEQDKRLAVQMYERAVTLDPSFALAYVSLGEMHAELYGFFMDRTPERIARAKVALDRALALAPNLPQAHVVLGRYYLATDDLERAETALATALRLQPNNADALHRLGVLAVRRGSLHDAVEKFERAATLDPQSNAKNIEVGNTLKMLRQYNEAERYYERAIASHPEDPIPYYNKAELALLRDGDLAAAHQHIREAWEKLGDDRAPQYFFSEPAVVPLIPPETTYQNAVARLTLATFDGDTATYYLSKAQFFDGGARPKRSPAYADSARMILERAVRERPLDDDAHLLLALAYAWLGRAADVAREGRRAVELRQRVSEIHATYHAEELARIYTVAGMMNEAVQELDRLLGVPSRISVPRLRSDPAWRRLWGQPQFEQLIRE
jgi:eukaryotic-like serine/threonine-protein kinase